MNPRHGMAASDPSSESPSAGTVAVAVCTRGRPRMLEACLASLHSQEDCGRPVVTIVVDNTPGAVAGDASADGTIRIVEPVVGIANARNRALDEALHRGCRWLAFIDDDEIAEPGWLRALLARAIDCRLVLVGGPVRLMPAPADATREQATVWRGVERRFADSERRAARKAAAGDDGAITVVTNNWLCDLDFVRRHGLHFDRSTAFSGGSDAAFYRSVREHGGATGWAPEAVVREEWPANRLTLAYHRQRGRDQTLARFVQKRRKRGMLIVPEAAAVAAARWLSASYWRLRSLFDGGVSRVRAERAMGAAAGIVAAMRGERSSHYERVTGD